jgi:hypothetical protein
VLLAFVLRKESSDFLAGKIVEPEWTRVHVYPMTQTASPSVKAVSAEPCQLSLSWHATFYDMSGTEHIK